MRVLFYRESAEGLELWSFRDGQRVDEGVCRNVEGAYAVVALYGFSRLERVHF